MCIVAAVAGAAGIGAAGNIVGGVLQSNAQNNATNTQRSMFDTIVNQEQPFLNAGAGASQTLAQLLGTSNATGANGTANGTNLPGGYLTQTFNPTMDQLQNYPGYQFALKTGQMAIRNADTPGVGALSGAALKDLLAFNQGLASTYYGNYFNQFQEQQNNIFNRLSGLAGLGQNAAGNLGNQGATLGTGIAQSQAAAGASLGAGVSGALNNIGQGAALSSILSSGGGGSSYIPNLNYGLPTSGFASYGG